MYAVATHGLFSENACELLEDSPITEVQLEIAMLYNKLIEHNATN